MTFEVGDKVRRMFGDDVGGVEVGGVYTISGVSGPYIKVEGSHCRYYTKYFDKVGEEVLKPGDRIVIDGACMDFPRYFIGYDRSGDTVYESAGSVWRSAVGQVRKYKEEYTYFTFKASNGMKRYYKLAGVDAVSNGDVLSTSSMLGVVRGTASKPLPNEIHHLFEGKKLKVEKEF